MAPRDRSTSFGFHPAPGTNYSVGQEPAIASRLDRLAKALRIRLTGISGYRTPAHSVAVGGFANDPHTQGAASDTPGIQNVPEATLERFGLTRPFSGAREADHIQLLARSVKVKGGNIVDTNVPNYVPAAYVPWVRTAAQQTGLSGSIVAAQINTESGFNAQAKSSAGAEGVAQFEPGTFRSYGKGSPYNPQDALGAYVNYMNTLLQQYNGNVRNALAAYNAGPANIAAGYGYADAILAKAGAPRTATAGSPSSFGGTRPGGQPANGQGADVSQVFDSYEAELTMDRTAPASTFSGSGWSAPFQWWWQSFSGQYAQEQSGGG